MILISAKFQTWKHLIPQFRALWGYFLPIWFIGISGSSDGHCPLSALYFSKNKKNGGDDNWNPIRFPLIWFFLMLTISIAFPSMMSMEFSSNLKTSEPTISISCKKNFFSPMKPQRTLVPSFHLSIFLSALFRFTCNSFDLSS